jgi:hypothetical protein
VPEDLLAFELVFRDAFLHDVGDEVEVPVIFSLRHEDVTAARCIVMRRLWITDESNRWLAHVLNEYAGCDQGALGSQIGEDVGCHVIVAGDVVEL